MKCPCKGCQDRTITCHGVCQKYQDWKQEREEIKKRILYEKPITNYEILKRQREKIIKIQRGQMKRMVRNYD